VSSDECSDRLVLEWELLTAPETSDDGSIQKKSPPGPTKRKKTRWGYAAGKIKRPHKLPRLIRLYHTLDDILTYCYLHGYLLRSKWTVEMQARFHFNPPAEEAGLSDG